MGMTIEDAIKHCEEVAEKKEKIAIYTPIEMLNSDVDIEKCQACADEHRQLAEWLRKYQKIQEIVNSKTTRLSYELGFRQIRKVIEDGTD